MRYALPAAFAVLAVALVSRGAPLEARSSAASPQWNASAAAQFLDQRLEWWRNWPKAQRDHGTQCVSCHTSVPHALAMPSLRREVPGLARTNYENAAYDDITKRVYLWQQVEPFYPDKRSGLPKSSESRGVEGVLNALILATRDKERGYLAADTRQAFANMWGQQLEGRENKGGFAWLNFRLEPFEAPASVYYGAALAAVALNRAPGDYAADPAIAGNVDALKAYLRTGLAGSLYVRTLILWADANLPGVLTPEEKRAIIGEITAAQDADGGWSLASLSDWKRVDQSALPEGSHGFATSLIAVALREAGEPVSGKLVSGARNWIAANQGPDGRLFAPSINKERAADHDAYLFLTDQATAMAALAMAK